MLERLRRPLAGVLLAAAVVLVTGCGGGDSGNVQALLDEAFSKDISSADLRVDSRIQVDGGGSAGRPVQIQATGPFRSNDGKLPSVDLELRIGSDGGGQTVQTGFLSTGDRAFVKFQDIYYEQPAEEVRKANESIAKDRDKERSAGTLGLDPRSWLAEARERGEEQVAGTNTVHVSGSLDVTAFLRDLNDFVKRSRGAISGATGQQLPAPLSEQSIEKAEDVVRNADFDVYVGEDDDIIRRVSGRLDLTVPEEDRASFGGIEGGSIELSVEFGDVNGDQKIEAPANARPLSELTRSLGGSALGDLSGSGMGSGGAGGGGAGSGGGGGTIAPGPPASSSPDADDFREYGECLEQAQPEDTEALQRCAELLQGR